MDRQATLTQKAQIREDDIQCTVCLLVRDQPFECKECGQLICDECLAGVDSCPSCRGEKSSIVNCVFAKRLVDQLSNKWKDLGVETKMMEEVVERLRLEKEAAVH